MNTTIKGLQLHFAGLYDLRNYFTNGSLPERAMHFNRRVGRIADAKRKDERICGRLARAVSYFISCVNYYGTHLDLELGLMEKFPLYGCLYCGNLPCDCTEKRPDPTKYVLHEEQRGWTIRQWQAHFKTVYGHRNMGKFEKAFLRFTSEFGEFAILSVNGPDTPIYPRAKLEACRRELADLFNWLLTLAYIEGIDLEKEVVDRYAVCPGCKRESDCQCPLVMISENGLSFSTVGTPDYLDPNLNKVLVGE